MRTQDEIVARVREQSSFFGFEKEVLLPYLDFEHAKEFLKPEMTQEKWEALRIHEDGSQQRFPLPESAILPEFRAYAAFAWGKAQSHRGLSASRSVEKLSAWTWLLGRDDVLKLVESAEFAMYGCPVLKIVCEAFGFPVPDDEATQRMMRGASGSRSTTTRPAIAERDTALARAVKAEEELARLREERGTGP